MPPPRPKRGGKDKKGRPAAPTSWYSGSTARRPSTSRPSAPATRWEAGWEDWTPGAPTWNPGQPASSDAVSARTVFTRTVTPASRPSSVAPAVDASAAPIAPEADPPVVGPVVDWAEHFDHQDSHPGGAEAFRPVGGQEMTVQFLPVVVHHFFPNPCRIAEQRPISTSATHYFQFGGEVPEHPVNRLASK